VLSEPHIVSSVCYNVFMKTCKRCGREKHRDEFGYRPDGRTNSYCKPCKLEYDKEYYQKSAGRRDWQRNKNEESRARNKEYVWKTLEQSPCVDCGEDDPTVLQFDHVRGEKLNGVMTMVQQSVSIKKLKEEIAKCEVRCANCHMRATAKRAGTWRTTRRIPSA
jgi:hypothetical protein